jgi:hypothetical protein
MLKDDPPHSSMFPGLASSAGTPGDYLYLQQKNYGILQLGIKKSATIILEMLRILILIGSRETFMVPRKIKN